MVGTGHWVWRPGGGGGLLDEHWSDLTGDCHYSAVRVERPLGVVLWYLSFQPPHDPILPTLSQSDCEMEIQTVSLFISGGLVAEQMMVKSV